jgi:hypothetical protein
MTSCVNIPIDGLLLPRHGSGLCLNLLLEQLARGIAVLLGQNVKGGDGGNGGSQDGQDRLCHHPDGSKPVWR